MNINHLKIYCTVYETQSTTKAAEKLYITQPAVSRVLHELENTYDIHLFERFNRHLVPTPEGREFYEKASRIIALNDAMEQELKAHNKKKTLRIGATVTIGTWVLPSLCADFQKQHADIIADVRVENAEKLLMDIHKNELDIGLVEDAVSDMDLTCTSMGENRMIAVCAYDKEIGEEHTVRQLSSYPLLVREKGSTAREWIERILQKEKCPLHPAWESSNVQALLMAAAYGLGIAVVPEISARSLISEKKIKEIKIKDVTMSRKMVLVYHKDKYVTPEMQAFMEMIQ